MKKFFTTIAAGILSIFTLAVPVHAGEVVGIAEARIGSNGSNEGIAEADLWAPYGVDDVAHTKWDEDESDGIDSDWVSVVVDVDTTGNFIMHTGNGMSLYGTVGALDQLFHVKLRAEVTQNEEQSLIDDIQVYFYDNVSDTTPAEIVSMTQSGRPQASTIGMNLPSSSLPVLKDADIWADGLGYQKARIFCSIRMTTTQPGEPNPESVFTQIFIYNN